MATLKLPPEPRVLEAARAFPDSQALMAERPVRKRVSLDARADVGWFGTSLLVDRGSFAYVDSSGPLKDFVGDYLELTAGVRSVRVYVVGALDDAGLPLFISRRAFLGLEILAKGSVKADVRVLE